MLLLDRVLIVVMFLGSNPYTASYMQAAASGYGKKRFFLQTFNI